MIKEIKMFKKEEQADSVPIFHRAGCCAPQGAGSCSPGRRLRRAPARVTRICRCVWSPGNPGVPSVTLRRVPDTHRPGSVTADTNVLCMERAMLNVDS